MLGNLKGMVMTFITSLRTPVTAQYPDVRMPVEERRMGFPMLLWDDNIVEPYCTGCMVCVRECPTKCMSATMTDNPKHAEGTSHRRKIIDVFEINIGRFIICGICVDVCNFDAIEMSYETELSTRTRNGRRMDLGELLERGYNWQAQSGWIPASQRVQNSEEQE